MIRFACPLWKSVLEASDRKAGSKIACPKCQQRLQIPSPARNKTILAPLAPAPILASAPMPVPAGRMGLVTMLGAMLVGAALVGGGIFLGMRLLSDHPQDQLRVQADGKLPEKVADAGKEKKPEQPKVEAPKDDGDGGKAKKPELKAEPKEEQFAKKPAPDPKTRSQKSRKRSKFPQKSPSSR